MKLTDFALIFAAIFLPVVITVYINTSFVVKSEKQEMYYKNLMNSAVADAVSAMKHIENDDSEIDYGYSGIVDKKVSINANTAVSTFYSSLANNFNIANNENALSRLKMYIPVVAILDYDGIYIHSAEENEAGNLEFVTKPKVYYTYSYVITKDTNGIYVEQPLSEVGNLSNIQHVYEVNFTMDDYIYLNVYDLETDTKDIVYSGGFYLTDSKNNINLAHSSLRLDSITKGKLIKDIVDKLEDIKAETIAKIGMKEISYAVNKHNDYAKQAGITYTFRFAVESDSSWYETMDGIGMIAMIQGVSLGNRYLNYKAYSASDLIVSKKYYVSKGVVIEGKDVAYLSRDLYHVSTKCTAYLEYANSTADKVIPSFYSSKADAATQGFYPCPICKP